MNKTHPSPHDLAAFGLGKLPASLQEIVENHVAECQECCAKLVDVQDDKLAKQIRKPLESERQTSISSGWANTQAENRETPLRDDEILGLLKDHPKYRILKRLGAGGMGVVFLAEHRLMRRRVAMKVVRPAMVSNQRAVERFHIEVQAAAKLHHPNIVAAYDAEQLGTLHVLVMEYVQGKSVDKLVSKLGPLSIARACSIAQQVAFGLEHAAEHRMVHRDIKPQNLIITRTGDVKILDFGLARFAREQEQDNDQGDSITQFGTVLGTPDYMAPEQAADPRMADIRADLYSLGCTLHFLLTGESPFEPGSFRTMVLTGERRRALPIRSVRESVPGELARILERLMKWSADDRYSTPAEVAALLTPFIRPTPKVTTKPSSPSPAVAAVISPDVQNEPPLDHASPFDQATPQQNLKDDLTESATLDWNQIDDEDEIPTVRKSRASNPKGNKIVPWMIAGGCVVVLIAAGLAVNPLVWDTENNGGTSVAVGTPPPAVESSSPGEGEKTSAPPTSHVSTSSRVLMVIGFRDFWYKDYLDVRKQLESRGLEVVVASSSIGLAQPDAQDKGKPVQVDVRIDQVKGENFDAVVFCGGTGISEFCNGGSSQPAAREIIDEFMDDQKLVTAICLGPKILADAGILSGVEITCWSDVRDYVSQNGAVVVDRPFHVWNNIITGRDPSSGNAFADAIYFKLKSD